LADDDQLLYLDAESGGLVRYNVETETKTVLVNNSLFVSIVKNYFQ